MKKFLVLVLAFLLLVPAASADQFPSLRRLQDFLMTRSPDQISATGPHYADLDGVVLDIRWTGEGNHWELTLQVDQPDALKPIGADAGLVTVHFRLHQEVPPVAVGDEITVFGEVNPLYSSVMVPWILARTINGVEP